MRTVQDIVFGVTGQTVYFDATEGRPSSVTSGSVFLGDAGDDSTAESAVGAPSVETNPNTTVDAASGSGQTDPRILNVTATTGFATDRAYLVTSADGLREWFEVREIDSGNSVTAKHPLHNAYASADTVQSTRISATIDATWVADSGNLGDPDSIDPQYRVRWVYVVAGVTYVADTYFNLVRYAARQGVSALDLDSLVPGWLDMLPTDYREDQGRKLIADAYREVRIDLTQIDLSAAQVAQSELTDELVRYKAVELGEWGKFLAGGNDPARAESSSKRYAARLDAIARLASRVPVRTVSGAATSRVPTGLTRR